MLLTGSDHAHAPGVVPALDHTHRADLELAFVLDLAGLQIHEDRVVRLDVRIRDPRGAPTTQDMS